MPGLPALSAATSPRCCCPAVGVAIVGYSDNVLTGPRLRHPARQTGSRRRPRARSPSAPPTWPPACCAGSRSAAAAAGPRSATPQGSRTPAALAGRPRAGRRWCCSSRGPLLARSRWPRSARVVIYAALRLVDIAELPPARPVPPQRAGARRGHHGRRPAVGRALRRAASRSGCRSLDLLVASPARTTASSATCPGSPACTTSTTTPTRDRSPGWSSTATTRRCSSPTPRTSAAARSPPLDDAPSRRDGSCSTPRRTSRSTSPPPDALEELRDELQRARHRARDGPRQAGSARDLRAAGLLDLIGEERIFPTLPTAVEAFRSGPSPPRSRPLRRHSPERVATSLQRSSLSAGDVASSRHHLAVARSGGSTTMTQTLEPDHGRGAVRGPPARRDLAGRLRGRAGRPRRRARGRSVRHHVVLARPDRVHLEPHHRREPRRGRGPAAEHDGVDRRRRTSGSPTARSPTEAGGVTDGLVPLRDRRRTRLGPAAAQRRGRLDVPDHARRAQGPRGEPGQRPGPGASSTAPARTGSPGRSGAPPSSTASAGTASPTSW